MKKIISFVLTIIMALSISVSIFAITEPGKGAEMKRPNNSSLVVEYFEGKNKLMWEYYEAEDAQIFNDAKISNDFEGYSGSGCVAMTCWKGNSEATPGIKFTVNAVMDGEQKLYIGYNNAHEWAQSANLIVNGEKSKLYFPIVKKHSWSSYGMICVDVTLREGENSVILQLDKDDYPTSFYIDFIAVSKGDSWKDEICALELVIGSNVITKITYNGRVAVETDVAPIIKGGRTFVPIRGIFEITGAEVSWNGSTKTATIKTEDDTVTVGIGNDLATVNGKTVVMDAEPFIQDGRTLIPLRFISENLGYKIAWDGETQTITITVINDEPTNSSSSNESTNSSSSGKSEKYTEKDIVDLFKKVTGLKLKEDDGNYYAYADSLDKLAYNGGFLSELEKLGFKKEKQGNDTEEKSDGIGMVFTYTYSKDGVKVEYIVVDFMGYKKSNDYVYVGLYIH